jgi:hypothetical protein
LAQQRNREELFKRYLLGTLSDEERDQLEQRYFSDDAEFEYIEIAEDDLIDQYVRGELVSDERDRFAVVASNSPRLLERVEFARLLSRKTAPSSSQNVTAAPPQPRWWQSVLPAGGRPARLAFGFGGLVVLLSGLLIGSAWYKVREDAEAIAAREAALEQRRQEIERHAAESKAKNDEWASALQSREVQLQARELSLKSETPDRPASELIAVLNLRSGSMRSEGPGSEALLTQNTSRIRLNLELVDSDYNRYRAVVFTPDVKPVSRVQLLTPRRTPSGDFLVLQIPAKGLTPGNYFVRIEGLTQSGAIEGRYDYQFRLNSPR